ncbi:MAG: hypothetical protein RQ741_02995 [Wenzhouxiangellaceae bacterium]|nr:hypothetical protein [Wenzhouxiangellaceae bacterium]
MISKFLTAAGMAGFAVAAVAQPVELVLDDRSLVNFDVPLFAANAGIRKIDYFPFEQPPRIAIQTRLADLTCEFQNGIGAVVDSPFADGHFIIEIDRIPTPFGQRDPNMDFEGQPITRQYSLDPASGSIAQIFLGDATTMDICTSGSACAPVDGDSVQLFCREAGTQIFDGDFEPPTLGLDGSATASPERIVAGTGGFDFQFGVANSGDLTASDLVMSVGLDPLLADVTQQDSAVVSRGSYDAVTGLWTIGTLEQAAAAFIDFSFSAGSSVPAGTDFCGAMILESVAGDVIDQAAAGSGTCTRIDREYDLEAVVAQSFPSPGTSVVAASGSVSMPNLEFLFEVGHVDKSASDASDILAGILISGPGGASLPAGTVVVNGIDVPTGDSLSGIGLQREWGLGILDNNVTINPRAAVLLTVFEGIGDGAQVCLTGSILSTAVDETDVDGGNASGEVCATVSDPSTP